jgi:hypothetical protein
MRLQVAALPQCQKVLYHWAQVVESDPAWQSDPEWQSDPAWENESAVASDPAWVSDPQPAAQAWRRR